MWGETWTVDLSDLPVARLGRWRGYHLRRWGEVTLPSASLDALGVVRDPQAVAECLRSTAAAMDGRPRKIRVILPPQVYVEQTLPVPRMWPWERKTAAVGLAQRCFALNPATTFLRATWRGRRQVQLVAVLRDALAGVLASVRLAGWRPGGVETVASYLARIARDGPVIQMATGHVLAVVCHAGIPRFSAWTRWCAGERLDGQVLGLLEACRTEAGAETFPSEGPVLLVGTGTHQLDAGLLQDLAAAGWRPQLPPELANLPPGFLPRAPRTPRPLDLKSAD